MSEALNRSNEAELDLVEVAPNSEPPVCRIMDYGRWLYEEKRKLRENRKKSQHHSVTLKEVRLRPETDPHDLEIKLNRARKFLEKGHKVQFSLMFRGRQMLHREIGFEIMEKIATTLEDVAHPESTARMANRRMLLILIPNKK